MSDPLFTDYHFVEARPKRHRRISVTPRIPSFDAPPAMPRARTDTPRRRALVLSLSDAVTSDQDASVATFFAALQRITGSLAATRQERAIERLAEVILPDALADARGALAADNLALRDRFIAATAPLTSAEVQAAAGHSGRNPYATAARWKKSGEIFSVHHRGTEYFPAFQFREGRPHPTIKPVLAALPPRLSPWQRAFWFVSTNGWLADVAPVDRLDDMTALVAAATREREDVTG